MTSSAPRHVRMKQSDDFEAGFAYVLRDWKAGMPWEQSVDLATTPANKRSHAFTSGARAAANALSGWLDDARRSAKHFGLATSEIERLIESTRYENLFGKTHHATKKSPAQMKLKWKREPGSSIQAPISHGGDRHHYVISHRPEDHTVSFRPPGEHHHVGSYRTERAAKVAAQQHAETGAAPPSNTRSVVAAWGTKGPPPEWQWGQRKHATKKKSSQLNREIAEVLATTSHATKSPRASGGEWSDLTPTGLRVQTHSGDMPLEEATPAEIRHDMGRRLAGFRALINVPVRRKKWSRDVYALVQAKPWIRNQVPNDVWKIVLSDLGESGAAHATRRKSPAAEKKR